MKILLLPDKERWAYSAIAQSLIKYNHRSDVKLKVMHIKGNEALIKKKYKKYDKVLVMGWQNYERVSFIDKSITMVGLHSFHSWDDKKTTPDRDVKPPKKLIKHLSSFLAVNAVSQRLTNLFKKHGLRNVHYTPNGVDTQIFKSTVNRPLGKTLVVGYSGSKAHDWRKGVSKFIIPASKKSGVKFRLAMLSSKDYIPLDQMHTFYNQIDCYICASSSEGMSLSVLEAAACGCPVITTRVSGCTEIIKEGSTGFLVDRDVKSISKKIDYLKHPGNLQVMGLAIEEDIKNNWCWSKMARSWIEFMRDS